MQSDALSALLGAVAGYVLARGTEKDACTLTICPGASVFSLTCSRSLDVSDWRAAPTPLAEG
jgi:hypothetical protein